MGFPFHPRGPATTGELGVGNAPDAIMLPKSAMMIRRDGSRRRSASRYLRSLPWLYGPGCFCRVRLRRLRARRWQSAAMFKTRSLGKLILIHELAFVFLVVLTGSLGVASAYFWRDISSESQRIHDLKFLSQEVRRALSMQIQQLIRARVMEESEALEAYSDSSRRIDRLFARMHGSASNREELQKVQRMHQQYRLLQQDMNQVFSDPYLLRTSPILILDPQFAQRMIGRFDKQYRKLHDLLSKESAALQLHRDRWTRAAPLGIPLLLLLALLLVLFSRSTLRRGFIHPMGQLIEGASAISQGNLDRRLDLDGVEEIGTLADAINRMSADLAVSRNALVQQERQAALGALVPVVAHNIRNPLASIRAMAQLLERGGDAKEFEEQRGAILRTVDRLGRWVSALVSYLHPLQPKLRSCELDKVWDSVIVMLDDRIRAQELHVRREGWNGGHTVPADPDLVEQLFYNLLANAVDASPRGGKLCVGLRHSGSSLETFVRDSGLGLPFDPRPSDLSPGPSTKRFGTGLGIPIAFKLCECHGWQLRYRRPSEGGAEASVIVPLVDREVASD